MLIPKPLKPLPVLVFASEELLPKPLKLLSLLVFASAEAELFALRPKKVESFTSASILDSFRLSLASLIIFVLSGRLGARGDLRPRGDADEMPCGGPRCGVEKPSGPGVTSRGGGHHPMGAQGLE